DNVLGDVVEALLGALYLEAGHERAAEFVQRAWAGRVTTQETAPKHPKSALQEWAAANDRKPPVYSVADRSGPHHAPRFTVEVEIPGLGKASADGQSKQEAETEAAKALLEQLK
ncbi:MAG: ribonuclease, partial [Sphingomonadales bacterium]|nr:ribonuclease [Sphingomonadales bacterium]